MNAELMANHNGARHWQAFESLIFLSSFFIVSVLGNTLHSTQVMPISKTSEVDYLINSNVL